MAGDLVDQRRGRSRDDVAATRLVADRRHRCASRSRRRTAPSRSPAGASRCVAPRPVISAPSASRSAASSRARARGCSPPCRYDRAAGRAASTFFSPRLGSASAAADRGGTMRSPDGIITSAGLVILRGTMRLPPTIHRPVPGRLSPYQPIRQSRAVGPASGAPSFSQSSSSTKSRAGSPCWSMPRKRPNFFIASHGSTDQNRVCSTSTGSSPSLSATCASSGPDREQEGVAGLVGMEVPRCGEQRELRHLARLARGERHRRACRPCSSPSPPARGGRACRRRRPRARGARHRPRGRSAAPPHRACPSRPGRAAGPPPPWRAAGSSRR